MKETRCCFFCNILTPEGLFLHSVCFGKTHTSSHPSLFATITVIINFLKWLLLLWAQHLWVRACLTRTARSLNDTVLKNGQKKCITNKTTPWISHVIEYFVHVIHGFFNVWSCFTFDHIFLTCAPYIISYDLIFFHVEIRWLYWICKKNPTH